jgi:hypothetical protein
MLLSCTQLLLYPAVHAHGVADMLQVCVPTMSIMLHTLLFLLCLAVHAHGRGRHPGATDVGDCSARLGARRDPPPGQALQGVVVSRPAAAAAAASRQLHTCTHAVVKGSTTDQLGGWWLEFTARHPSKPVQVLWRGSQCVMMPVLLFPASITCAAVSCKHGIYCCYLQAPP